MILPITAQFKHEVHKNFDDRFDLKKRLTVIADTEMFDYMGDKSVWMQKRNKLAKYFTVYIDGIFVSGFHEDMPKEHAMLGFWEGLHKAIKEDKLRLHPALAKELEAAKEFQAKEEKKEEKRLIDALPEATPTEKMAKHVIKKVKNVKGKKSK